MDARVDAPVDAAIVPDSGPAPDDPLWVEMPGLTEECTVMRAQRPEVLFEPVWEPCRHHEGCQKLSNPGNDPVAFWPGFAGHDGERGYFMIVQGRGNNLIDVLATTDGPPLGAWRHSVGGGTPCSTSPQGVSIDGRHAFFAIFLERGGEPERRFYQAPIAEIGSVEEPFAIVGSDIAGGNGSANAGAVSSSAVVAEIPSADGIVLMRKGEARVLPSDLPGGVAMTPLIVGDTALWTDWDRRARILRGSFEQPAELYLESVDSDIQRLASDGEQLAWAVGVWPELHGLYQRIEIWTSPYSPDPADLQPHLLAGLGSTDLFSDAIVSNGMYVFWDTPEEWVFRLVYYELETGIRHEYMLPEGFFTSSPVLYATPDEIAVVTPRRLRGPSTILRIATSAFSVAE